MKPIYHVKYPCFPSAPIQTLSILYEFFNVSKDEINMMIIRYTNRIALISRNQQNWPKPLKSRLSIAQTKTNQWSFEVSWISLDSFIEWNWRFFVFPQINFAKVMVCGSGWIDRNPDIVSYVIYELSIQYMILISHFFFPLINLQMVKYIHRLLKCSTGFYIQWFKCKLEQ